MAEDEVFEMLWDCRYCGAAGLLGVTHRHCPSCGAPQDAGARYFPSDAQKVRLRDHRYVGADRRCGACGEAGSAAAEHCGNCGAPLTEARAVALRAEQVHAQGAFAGDSVARARAELRGEVPSAEQPRPAPTRLRRWLKGCLWSSLALLALFIALIVVGALWTQKARVSVVEQRWSHTVVIERYEPVELKAWCDQLPAGAQVLSRSREQRGSHNVRDGEECHTVKKDRGDGSFVEEERCSPRYRSEPDYDDSCRYRSYSWVRARDVAADGNGTEPRWPEVRLERPGTCVGCEREGARRATYEVALRVDGTTEVERCELPVEAWRQLPVGKVIDAEQRRLTGSIDCTSISGAPVGSAGLPPPTGK